MTSPLLCSGREPIAIVGSSCRFPGGANTPSKLWELLQQPRDVLVDIPTSRFNPDGFFHEDGEYHGSTNVRKAYLVDEDYRTFDYNFFNISPKEAESMDPQQRILLEVVYEGLESAGIPTTSLKGSSTSVFVGQMSSDYYDLLLRDIDCVPQYTSTGTSRAVMSNRISYFFDWKGPSMTIDTACSSSLVALHQAVQALRFRDTELAIVAGVNLVLGPENFILGSKLHMLSPSGRCRMWDSKADGYARGEGVAAVVLKTLKQAIADNDHIECVIRETGVNQDGQTSGLTVPSTTSQSSLIKSTYHRCGLDLQRPEDRCQYFEAHGTGTLVGDPKEAAAIHNVFFPKTKSNVKVRQSELYVGSIKTVIGHLEGTAGLAGLLKASLAVQHGIIPPNMHFEKLNPAIEDFYENLHIPTKPRNWPALPYGVPRRASVNSFGFGGTNAHVIIESWECGQGMLSQSGVSGNDQEKIHSPYGPITISAKSESALLGAVTSLYGALERVDDMSLRNLAWTLQSRRTELPYKTTFSGVDKKEIMENLRTFLDTPANERQKTIQPGPSSSDSPPRILGIFTGQGAQWPQMGSDLYLTSVHFRNTIHRLEEHLNDLPDPPSWSLRQELTASGKTSRVHLGEISQPLTTAVQVALIDILSISGVKFSAVVGHSSGEIAAAYAAGYLTACDAIRISYYRGLHLFLASSIGSQPGKMMAAEISLSDAQDFCDDERFLGRLCVAASNDETNVTMSGDADAIDEIKQVLEEKKIFVRTLKVDKAYHSHHIEPCIQPFLSSLRRLDIKYQCGKTGCRWYSSVYGNNSRAIQHPHGLSDAYWAENMRNSVLFSEAIDRMVTEEKEFHLALEIGPHPALRYPVIAKLRMLKGLDIPYHGTLERNKNDLNALSDALGFIWKHTHTSHQLVDFNSFREACEGSCLRPLRVLKCLGSYTWDHSAILFRESRRSRIWRTRERGVHKLLGVPSSHVGDQEMRWRNIMRLKEMSWLRGHRFQGQVIFPVAGYISMLYEAAVIIAKKLPTLVELQDLVIRRAITFDEGDPGIETNLVIRIVSQSQDSILTECTCYSSNIDASSQQSEQINFTGRAIVRFNTPLNAPLPSRSGHKLPLIKVDINRFYESMSECGLRYSGNFRVHSVQRRSGLSTVTTARDTVSSLRIDPPTLDAALHGLFAAFHFPGDGTMWTSYLPTSIRRIRINSTCPQSRVHGGTGLIADCYLRHSSSKSVKGDIDIFCANDYHPEIQIQGLACSAITAPSPMNDVQLFARTIWKRDPSSGIEPNRLSKSAAVDSEVYTILERSAYFFFRELRRQISREEISSMEWNFQYLMDWVLAHLLPTIESGNHTRIRKEWRFDTRDMITAWRSRYSDRVDLQTIHAIGNALPSIVRGSVPALQVLRKDDMISKCYQYGLGAPQANKHLEALVSNLAHKYPRMNILEVGAGTGGATRAVLKALGNNFHSYAFTDISSGFFEDAQSVFAEYNTKITYQVLDIECDPEDQGFKANSFDLVIASNVLHATRVLSRTLENCRSLIRPGGYMILVEICGESLWPQFVVSGLPGWWLGREDGRTYQPTVSESRWERLLQQHGFSGLDQFYKDAEDDLQHTYTVMVSQAVDNHIEFLRQPLAASNDKVHIDNMVLIGGRGTWTSITILEIQRLLRPVTDKLTILYDLEEFDKSRVKPGMAVICIADIEEPVFRRMSEGRFKALKLLFTNAKYVMWVTRDYRHSDPYASMVVGLGRSVLMEHPYLRAKFIDIDSVHSDLPAPVLLSESFLRMIYLDLVEDEKLLWSNETEETIINGRLYIPRVCPDDSLNQRYNAGRREILKSLSPASVPIALVNETGTLKLQEFTRVDRGVENEDYLQIRTLVSSICPIYTSDRRIAFPCIGSVVGSGLMVFTISSVNCSLVKSRYDEIFSYEVPGPASAVLNRILTVLLCESLLVGLTGTLWMHDADSYTATVFSEISSRNGINVFFSASARPSEKATIIHEHITERDLEHLVPRNVQRFADMGTGQTTSIGDILKSRYEHEVDIQHVIYDIDHRQAVVLNLEISEIRRIIARELSQLALDSTVHVAPDESVLEVDMIPHTSQRPSNLKILDWRSTEPLPVRISTLGANSCFSEKKTYLFIGLSGDVGLSLCAWMIDHGAKYFAFGSRNPAINSEEMSYLESKGGNIRTFILDVADKQALEKVYDELVSTMPPVAGVVNGAMVLRDTPLETLSLDDFESVLRPKVDGSRNLDDLFHCTSLDFFVLLSSTTRVLGNPAQSNYAAANMYMSTLAAQRRKRGLAASTLDIPMLLGVGYLTRSLSTQGSPIESQLRKLQYIAISESDFHIMFGEAITSGLPDSKLDPTLTVGIGQHSTALWNRFPRLWHYASSENPAAETRNQSERSKSLKVSLSGVLDHKEAFSSLEASLTQKLSFLLQMPCDQIDKRVPLTAFGIDSLVAVEIRSWILSELEVDVPVFEILNKASVMDICQAIVEKLPPLIHADEECVGRETRQESLVSPLQQPAPGASIGVMSPREHTTSSTSASTSPKAPGTSENDAEPISSRPITAGTAHSDEAEYERIGEMSHSQAQIYFLHQLLDDKSTHNVVLIGKFRGHLDLHQLRRALYYVCKHHEGLRSAFYIDKSCEKAVQSVKPEPVVTLKHMLIADAGQVRAEIDALGNRTFDIEKGHTMDVIVLSQTPLTHHIAFVHHHIVLDGISWGLFLHDLSRAFAEQNLQSPITQAIDVCNRRRLAYKPMYLEKELRFWSKLYENPPGILPLFPFAKVKTRQILKAYETETFDIKLNSELTNIVKQRAAEIQVTPCHIYLSTLAILLARCIGVYDFSIGMIDANRLEVNENEVIGNFLNILPLRFRLKRTDPFYKVALTTSKMVLAALENSRVPFDLILDQLKSSRSGSHHPLFQVALNYRLGVANQTPLGNGEIEWTKAIPPSNPYDLMVDITETRKYTVLSFTTHKYLYRPSDTKLLMKWYCRALEGLCRNTSIRVWDAPMANEADMKQMSILMQGEQMEITWEGTLVDRVDEIASQFPDSVAIKDGSGTILTYDQLRKRVGQIAECLQANAIPPDSRVAILLTPTADAICCLLAVMRSGLVWVPLDTRNPPSRLLAIITDCQPYTLISNAETRGLASELAKEVTYTLNLDDIILPDMPEVENSSERSNPAVILYTSGSTGVPKGVLLTHQSILNQIFANTILYGIKREVVLQQTSFGFDLALDQIFHALANGGTLIVVGHEGRGDPMHIARIIRSENITYTLLVPSEYLSLLHYGFNELKGCTSWSFAFAGGEKISFQLRRRFQKLGLPNLQLINIYGPTEASISCARGIVPYRSDEEISLENDSVWPMPNYTLAILDNRSKLAPIGFPGEICIAGVGLALGYVNRPEETRHKFTHPTVVLPEGCKHAKSIFYRTGDFGRLLEDGSLNILGRIAGDDQIKLRGFRIELGDVANVIMKAANNIITNAVISYRKETETLVAFVVFNNGFTGEKSIFSESLKAALPLPSYMCPAFIVPIEQIPTNHHGKVDRTAVDKLPIPSRNVSISTDDLSALELRMRNAWEEVLPRDTSPPSSIHLESDFFHVGGNSMLLIKLRSVLQTTFGVSLTLLELSQSSTLRSMTARVDKNPNAASPVWHINWETEVDALYDGLPSPRVTPSHNAQSDLVIILTGATGFVGRHILQHLVDDERVAQVHCIAIRPDNLGRPRHVPIQSSKIFEYPGNLSDSHLGLSDPAFQALTETADLIIHNGADVSFMKSYGTLRSTNVMSTRTLLELAVPRCIPFHFISTASVANFTGSSTLAEVSISNRTPPSNTIHGYAASKWVSESLLERVASEHGLRVWIHRPTNIVGHGAPESDIVAALLKYSQILRAVPEIKTQTIEGSLDLVSVEDVSMAIAQAALDSLIAKKRVALTFMHHCNGAKVASNELRGYIESMEECHCRVLNPSEWLELAREQGLDELIFLSLSSLFREGNKVMLPMLTKI